MLHKNRILSVFICISGLTSCSYFNLNPSPPITHNNPQSYNQSNRIYPESYESSNYSDASSGEKKPLNVPETYHVGAYHSPTSHSDRDRDWVISQNPQAFTIELADDDKASSVAKSLFVAPKNERTAEIKYQRDGKIYYKGVYGSYPTYEAAQQALSSLPEDVRQKAGVKSWESVQEATR